MRKLASSGLVVFFIATMAAAATVVYDESNFNAAGDRRPRAGGTRRG